MALIFCPECGFQISDYAIRCSRCSYPIADRLKGFNTHTVSTNYHPNIISSNTSSNDGLIIAGYIVAFFSIFIIPIPLMIAGIVLGIINITKNSIGHGVAHIILSIIFGSIGIFFGLLYFILKLL